MLLSVGNVAVGGELDCPYLVYLLQKAGERLLAVGGGEHEKLAAGNLDEAAKIRGVGIGSGVHRQRVDSNSALAEVLLKLLLGDVLIGGLHSVGKNHCHMAHIRFGGGGLHQSGHGVV